ncbi:MAG: Coenzyme F420 hydrogenase/dehydrogenase, beta subunit C-terminal domain [Gammaproteobacteria bacterium]|nr:Coenzyme F420 hydrogenase/dehydrogenase, beta subunit C-terminal domain [Gammaproteobacteria bacterium]MCH9743680.1 Coenzyme F420 hydrogenase/dehydrogenase, beta subunit C-terminal domain [Gammaproteobacteria bacterium]
MDFAKNLKNDVIDQGICVQCGLCVALDKTNQAQMRFSDKGPVPSFHEKSNLHQLAYGACPGKGIDYVNLYKEVYKTLPSNWLLGHARKVRIGYAADAKVRWKASSGGVIRTTLQYLLEQGIIDAAIVPKQLLDTPELAKPVITDSVEEVVESSQSIYTPVAMLEILNSLDVNKQYAITCTPDQAAAIRFLQSRGNQQAMAIRYLLGPYTGTALYPSAIQTFLKINGVEGNNKITKLEWRSGEWPGYLKITLKSGEVVRTPKFYYNYLIPFFITQSSLQSMDFTNEFCDLSVGDAWSPKYEAIGHGYSVFVTRSKEIENIIIRMFLDGRLQGEEIDKEKSLDMHGHMLDFKKRGSYIRNHMRKCFGKKAPDYNLIPQSISMSRILVECLICFIFFVSSLRFSRWVIGKVPERHLGAIFNCLRRIWKNMSKPTKRKGLCSIQMKGIETHEG